MKKQYTYLLYIAFGILPLLGFGQDTVNILNQDYYGFEKGTEGWWMQHPDNFSISNEQAANGSFGSLKYTNPNTASANLKAHGGTIPQMVINLSPGSYTMKAMVWLDPAAEITAFKTVLKPAFANTIFDLSSINKGEWVEVESTLNLTEAVSGGNFLVTVDKAFGGKGTMYIDNIQLFDVPPPVVEEIPISAEVHTLNSNNLTLDAGNYEITLKVWLDTDTTIKQFYTFIEEPWVSTKWDLSSIAKDQWVELTKEFSLYEKAEDTKFTIKVNNNPDFGGGKGAFYLDDIKINKGRNAYEDNDNFTLQTVGETCPNTNNGQIIITARAIENYQISFNGNTYNFNDTTTIDNVTPGVYDLCVSVENTTFESCFKVNIPASESISGKLSNKPNSSALNLNIVKGTPPFSVLVNSVKVLETRQRSFEIAAKSGDLVEVTTAKDCEGSFNEMVNVVRVFPNPASDILNIDGIENSEIIISNILGEQVYLKNHNSGAQGVIDVGNFANGLYLIKVIKQDKVTTIKLVKQ